jgi:hypothetical protein
MIILFRSAHVHKVSDIRIYLMAIFVTGVSGLSDSNFDLTNNFLKQASISFNQNINNF